MTYRIPEETITELRAYIAGQHPYPFGSFLAAVLANNLVDACSKADHSNITLLPEYASFLYNEMPGRGRGPELDFWGSYEAVENRIQEQWIKHNPE